MRHALAHRFHHASGFHTELLRQRHRVQAAALVDINKVQPHGMVADANLARAGLAHRHIHQLELLGTTVLVNANGA
ncbi:MAG: hypothetical protein ACD_23C00103G0001, partial [uncultured bacterium]